MSAVRDSGTVAAALRTSLVTALWFVFLTFPVMVVKVNPIEKTVQWRWWNMALVGAGAFLLSLAGRYVLRKKEADEGRESRRDAFAAARRMMGERNLFRPAAGLLVIFALVFPFLFS